MGLKTLLINRLFNEITILCKLIVRCMYEFIINFVSCKNKKKI